MANKKTFLLIHALETAAGPAKDELRQLLSSQPADKVTRMLALYRQCEVDDWALELKQQYFNKAMEHLEAAAVPSARKTHLAELAGFLVQRDY